MNDQNGSLKSGHYSTPPAILSGWILLGLVAVAPAVFALSTDNIWEDFFITFRCSLNLVEGNGLVYEVGRRLHVFTSPLGVLMPAGLSWLANSDDPILIMDLFRACSCLALAGAWGLVANKVSGRVAVALVAGFWLLDAKLAAYATNGMETGLLVLFVIMWWRALLDGRWGLAGLALGGAMWTRPDGFIYAGAVAIGILIFPGQERRLSWLDWVRIAGLAGVLYAPWFFWAWSYYGSPVPNTILAKGSQLQASESLGLLLSYPFRYVFGHCAAHDAFLPPYFFFGGWPASLWWFGKALALLTAGVVFWPRCARWARVAGLAFVLGGAYLTITARAPWYFPAWQVLAYIAVAGGATAALDTLALRPRWQKLIVGGLLGMVVVQGVLFVAVSTQLREQQRLIEWGLRAPLGRKLAMMANSTKDTVFLEPLGYIGFYSGLSMRDTPGLSSPEVIALRRQGFLSMGAIVSALRPEWLVLRPGEYTSFTADEVTRLDRDYRLKAIYDMRPAVNAVAWLPGRDFLLSDAYFAVWSRKTKETIQP